MKPSGVLEEIWVRDVVDLTWEVFRFRRLKAGLLSFAMSDGVRDVLVPLLTYDTLGPVPDTSDEDEDSPSEAEDGNEPEGSLPCPSLAFRQFVASDALVSLVVEKRSQ